MALKISIPKIHCFEESSDGVGSDEFLLLLAVLRVDTLDAESPRYFPGRQHTFAFYHDDFDSGESFELGHLDNSCVIQEQDNQIVEVLLVIKEIDSDESEEAIAALRSRWTSDIARGFRAGSRQGGNDDPLGKMYRPLAAWGQDGQDETLGMDVFELTFDENEVFPRTRSAVARTFLQTESSEADPGRFETFVGTIKTSTAVDESNQLDVRSYVSTSNDSSYEVHFNFRVVPEEF